MKVLMINGSPKANGNTGAALAEMEKIFAEAGVETEIVTVGKDVIRGCVGCGQCGKLKECVFNEDVVNTLAKKMDTADGFVIGSPVYYSSANGTLVSLLDRLMFSTGHIDKTMKVAAAVAVARRAGTTATLEVLNKYIMYGGFAVATSQYWNLVHGKVPGEAPQDIEGMQTMRTLARNMVFMMKSIALGKEQFGLPEKEERIGTDFIR